ncbi:MAG: TraB/GumN family protein [Nanoarchaeota archaeon]|nr:TraB/GumN family protein [Nanoarchaeota archaeon]
MKNLYLVGTVHIDIEGPRRLEGILRDISPDTLALESHKDRENLVSLRKSPEEEEREIDQILNETGLTLTPKQKSIALESGRILNSFMGYESRTCNKYVQDNPKTKLEYIDLSVFKNGRQEFIDGYTAATRGLFEEMVKTPELKEPFLELLNRGKDEFIQASQEGFNEMYKNAEMMEELIELLRDPKTFDMYIKKLPTNAVQALKQIYNPKRDESMANRINQLYNNGSHKLVAVVGLLHMPGLKSRLLDLEPITMTLADYDKNQSSIYD